jgi:hypothetical protein
MSNDCADESEKTWDAIAQSFDATRRKPWKQCIDFIDTFTKEDLVVAMDGISYLVQSVVKKP